jgi:hypothetical protein
MNPFEQALGCGAAVKDPDGNVLALVSHEVSLDSETALVYLTVGLFNLRVNYAMAFDHLSVTLADPAGWGENRTLRAKAEQANMKISAISSQLKALDSAPGLSYEGAMATPTGRGRPTQGHCRMGEA